MRRTYISIALLANGFDVKWVMSQVGHADSKMTMDVYAQLEQRVDRSHGTAFDELVRRAKGQQVDIVRDTFGTRGPSGPQLELFASPSEAKKQPADAGLSQVARPGLEPGTPRFSVMDRNLSNSRGIPAFEWVLAIDPHQLDVRKLRSFRVDLGTESRFGAQHGRWRRSLHRGGSRARACTEGVEKRTCG
jgi:hypothetical protein